MKIAWQTWIVLVLAVANFAFVAIVGNEPALGITAPWLTIVILPAIGFAIVLAGNQLKAIGSDTPPTPPPQPVKPAQ